LGSTKAICSEYSRISTSLNVTNSCYETASIAISSIL